MESNITADLKLLQECYFKKSINPDAVKLLGGGYSAANNYRIEVDGNIYLARVMSKTQALASREKESLLTEYAGMINVGPRVYYQNPQVGVIIAEFIEGRMATFDDMVQNPHRDLIITNVRRLHAATKLDFPKATTIAVRIQNTLARIKSSIFQQQIENLALGSALEALYNYEDNCVKTTLIHGDFNPGNILIQENRVFLIDWTDAGLGDPYSDISEHAMLFHIAEHGELLEYYFGYVNDGMQQKLLCFYCLRLFLLAIWAIEEAELLEKDVSSVFVEIAKKHEQLDPYKITVDVFSHSVILAKASDFLRFSNAIFGLLVQLTQQDQFLSAIEGASSND